MDGDPGEIPLERFLTLFHACMHDFDHFIEQNTVDTQTKGSGDIVVQGRLRCAGGTYLNIRIQLQRLDWARARVLEYSYHAGISGDPDRTIFRYDNAHIYLRERQPDAHHKHRFDPVTGHEIEPPEWIGADRVPSLCSALTELEQWWLETGQFMQRS